MKLSAYYAFRLVACTLVLWSFAVCAEPHVPPQDTRIGWLFWVAVYAAICTVIMNILLLRDTFHNLRNTVVGAGAVMLVFGWLWFCMPGPDYMERVTGVYLPPDQYYVPVGLMLVFISIAPWIQYWLLRRSKETSGVLLCLILPQLLLPWLPLFLG